MLFFPSMVQSPTQACRLIVKISRSHTHTHTHPVELLWMSDQLVAQAATYTTHNKHRRTSMPSAGYEPAIPAIKQLHTYVLERTATGSTMAFSVKGFNFSLTELLQIINWNWFGKGSICGLIWSTIWALAWKERGKARRNVGAERCQFCGGLGQSWCHD